MERSKERVTEHEKIAREVQRRSALNESTKASAGYICEYRLFIQHSEIYISDRPSLSIRD